MSGGAMTSRIRAATLTRIAAAVVAAVAIVLIVMAARALNGLAADWHVRLATTLRRSSHPARRRTHSARRTVTGLTWGSQTG
jgi:hypothetical protein